jgi:long-subunit acyl-CoA synthetase (AMP-forming)
MRVAGSHLSGPFGGCGFDNEGWFNTGDLSSIDELRHLPVHARRVDLVVTGGENVYPAEPLH